VCGCVTEEMSSRRKPYASLFCRNVSRHTRYVCAIYVCMCVREYVRVCVLICTVCVCVCYRAGDLRRLFEKYGEVRDVYIPRDYYTQ